MASSVAGLRDVSHLVNAPEFPNAVQWADDGTLAVAEGCCIAFLNPGDLSGASGFAALDGYCQDTVIAAPGDTDGSSVHFDLALSNRVVLCADKEGGSGKSTRGSTKDKKEATSQNRRPNMSSRAICWSPTGAATAGGCLLAAVTSDNKVLIFGLTGQLDPEWIPFAALHEDLLNSLQNTSWKVIEDTVNGQIGCGNGNGNGSGGRKEVNKEKDSSSSSSSDDDSTESEVEEDDEAVMRLRGGAGGNKGRRKQPPPPPPPPPVAVDNDEEDVEDEITADEEEVEVAAAEVDEETETEDEQVQVVVGGGAGGGVAKQGDDDDDPVQLPPHLPAVLRDQHHLVKNDIADATIAYFFQLRRAVPPQDVPTYAFKNKHLTGIDKANLEAAVSEYYTHFKHKLAAAGVHTETDFARECRVSLTRLWDRRNNVYHSGYDQVAGRGGGPGGIPGVPEEFVGEEMNIDGGGGGVNDEGVIIEEAAVGVRPRARGRKPAVPTPAAPTADTHAPAPAAAPTEAATEAVPETAGGGGGGSGTKSAKKKKKSNGGAPEVEFTREPYELPADFSWRELPAIDISTKAALRRTLIEGAVKRFLRLRADEPAALRPSYAGNRMPLKGLDAWLVGRVMKEYAESVLQVSLAAADLTTEKFKELWVKK